MLRPLQRLFFIALLAGAAALAAPLSTERASTLRTQFQTRQRATLTWSATFMQTLTVPGLREPVVSTGTLAYRAPEQLRLDFIQPAGEFVLVLGDQLFIQKAGMRLAEKSLREDSAGRPFLWLLGLLRGQPTEEESAYTPEATREEGRYAVVLSRKPDASSRMPTRIASTIAADTLELREVVVELPNGGMLSYRFDGIIRNRPLDTTRFAAPTEPTSKELR
ncbi:MAG: outer membrane lipoprotein carrier protein LolA [Gammaproteobacteria bacterium]